MTVAVRPHLSGWGARLSAGVFALLDQGLFAGTNFLVSVALARLLTVQAFGEFSISYSVYLLVAAVHTAMVSEPMQIFGAGKYDARFGRFLALTLYWHMTISAIAAALFGFVGACIYFSAEPGLATTFLTTALMIPVLLMYWMLRRVFYIRARPHLAVLGSSAYFVASLTGIYTLNAAGYLSPATAVVSTAVASLVASGVLMLLLEFKWRPAPGDPTFQAIAREYLGYGKWSCPTMLLSWVPQNVFYVVLPFFAPIQSAGILRALTNMIMPMLNAMVSSSSLLLPVLARRFQAGGDAQVRRTSEKAVVVLGAITLAYFALLALAGDSIVELIYGERYRGSRSILMVLALAPIFYGPVIVYDDALRATGRMSSLMTSYALSTAVALTLGLYLMWAFALHGASAAIVASTAASGCSLAYNYYSGRTRELAH